MDVYLNETQLSRAASSLTDRRELWGTVQNKRLSAEKSGEKEVILGKKAAWLLQGYCPLEDGSGLSGRLPN